MSFTEAYTAIYVSSVVLFILLSGFFLLKESLPVLTVADGLSLMLCFMEKLSMSRCLLVQWRQLPRATCLLSGGTSLVVYPAAGLVHYFSGSKLVIVNRDPTPQDDMADLIISCDIARAFSF